MRRRTKLEMVVDFLHEASVLVLVFGLMDHWTHLTPAGVAGMAVLSAALLGSSILIESRRDL